MELLLREARIADAPRIAEIYRPYVTDTAITFETEAPDADEMKKRSPMTKSV